MMVDEWGPYEIRALRKAKYRSVEAFAEELSVGRRTVYDWESGTSRPRDGSRQLLAKALRDAEADVIARFDQLVNSPKGPTKLAPSTDPSLSTLTTGNLQPDGGDDDVERKQFLQFLTGSMIGSAVTDLNKSASDVLVGVADVLRVRKRARTIAEQDHRFGGELSAPGAWAQLSAAAELVNGRFAHESVRRDYDIAVAELADITAGVCFDAGLHKQAEIGFRFAARRAIQAKDAALRAKALTGLANLTVHLGQQPATDDQHQQQLLDQALTYAEMALVRNDLLPSTLRSIVHSRHARALGALGAARGDECLLAVHRAEDCFALNDGRTPVWIGYYDVAHLQRDSGRALLNLALRGGGRYDDAYARLDSSLSRFPSRHSRGKALAKANLATLVMARDDPRHATDLGTAALDSIGSVQSDRVNDALRQLGQACQRHESMPDVVELRDRIQSLVAI